MSTRGPDERSASPARPVHARVRERGQRDRGRSAGRPPLPRSSRLLCRPRVTCLLRGCALGCDPPSSQVSVFHLKSERVSPPASEGPVPGFADLLPSPRTVPVLCRGPAWPALCSLSHRLHLTVPAAPHRPPLRSPASPPPASPVTRTPLPAVRGAGGSPSRSLACSLRRWPLHTCRGRPRPPSITSSQGGPGAWNSRRQVLSALVLSR